MAYMFGSLLAATAVIYLLSRLIEWALLKRIMKNPATIILTSTTLIFIVIFVLWLIALGKPQAQGIPIILSYLFASILLVFFRLRKAKK